MKVYARPTTEPHDEQDDADDLIKPWRRGAPIPTPHKLMAERLLSLPPAKRAEGDPTGGWSLRTTIDEGTLQGATSDNAGTDANLGASIDIDREKSLSRDHLSPGVWISLPSYQVTANTPLMIALPRWVRSIEINNASDLGTPVTLNVEIDGTPANAGDWPVRSGTIQSFGVFHSIISVYCTSSITLNSGLLGSVLLKATA